MSDSFDIIKELDRKSINLDEIMSFKYGQNWGDMDPEHLEMAITDVLIEIGKENGKWEKCLKLQWK